MSDTNVLNPISRTIAMFTDTQTAHAVMRTHGDAFENATNQMLLTLVSAHLYLGAVPAREAVKTLWADSKDKRREYATKVLLMCEKANANGKGDQLRDVTGFATLKALVPVASTPADKAPADKATPATNTPAVPDDIERVRGAISRMADISSALQALDAIAQALSAGSDTKKLADAKSTMTEQADRLISLKSTFATLIGEAQAQD
jgi:hypothetical protein